MGKNDQGISEKQLLKEKELGPPSDLFRLLLLDDGDPREVSHAVCGYCKRIHVGINDCEEVNEKKLKQIEKIMEDDPNKVVDHPYGDFVTADFEGSVYIPECPCNFVSRHEEWIWSHRDLVIKYYIERIKKMCEDADREAERINPLEKIERRLKRSSQ